MKKRLLLILLLVGFISAEPFLVKNNDVLILKKKNEFSILKKGQKFSINNDSTKYKFKSFNSGIINSKHHILTINSITIYNNKVSKYAFRAASISLIIWFIDLITYKPQEPPEGCMRNVDGWGSVNYCDDPIELYEIAIYSLPLSIMAGASLGLLIDSINPEFNIYKISKNEWNFINF